MTYYHGTTADASASILRDGLKPTPSKQWRIKYPSPFALLFGGYNNPDAFTQQPDDLPNVVFVTSHKARAIDFAKARAKYLQAAPNSIVPRTRSLTPVLKLDTTVVPDAHPALLKVELPDAWKLGQDEGLSDGFTSASIPAKYISQIPIR